MEIAKVDQETLEKSFEDSKATLLNLLGVSTEASGEALEKGKKGGNGQKTMDFAPEEDEESDEDEDEGGEEEEEGKKAVKKSLVDAVSEDPDAAAAMDVEPFLHQLVKSIDDRIRSEMDSVKKTVQNLQKSINGVLELQKAHGKLLIATGDLQKSVSDTVEKIGGQPVQSKSLIKAKGDRFEGSADGKVINREEILNKSLRLKNEGKITSLDVTKIEGRLNAGIPLGNYEKFFTEEAK